MPTRLSGRQKTFTPTLLSVEPSAGVLAGHSVTSAALRFRVTDKPVLLTTPLATLPTKT